MYLFSHPRATFEIRRASVLFPEDFGCNLTYYEIEKFSDSILRHISKYENFRYPNLGNEMRNSENRREFIGLASKIVYKLKNRTVI